MARIVYVNRKASNTGCGCLAIGLLLGLVFLKSFWRPILVILLVMLIWGWLKQLLAPDKRSEKGVSWTEESGFQDYPQDFGELGRRIKDAEVIEGDDDVH
ncbi:hypothetical protein [Streptococcus merionis]|uniref:Uncharacterized protein n=2 Tax=Streptococcus merionis TaxID=400065 RepID=A0A239SNU7_9STRE|nr:Uncharacterised protein [Streptococcus merionis]